jgi:hypothetical protein
MSIKHRVEQLEKMSNTDDGQIYFATLKDGVYIVRVNDETVEMSEVEFEKWQSSKSEKDYLFIVSYRDKKFN